MNRKTPTQNGGQANGDHHPVHSKINRSAGSSRRDFFKSAAGAAAATSAGQLLADQAAAKALPDRGDVFERLNRSKNDPKRRILIKGGTVLTMDPAVGDFAVADLLIEGGTIKAVGPNIKASDAAVVDASDTIVMPGFVDSHLHMFQTNIRSYFADAGYFGSALYPDYRRASAVGGVFEKYTPEDAYLGQYVGAVGNINGGVTTVVDMSQISHTPEHSDASIRAFVDAGLRTVYAYTGGAGSGVETSAFPQDIHRLKRSYFASNDQMVTLALNTGVDAKRIQLAREVGVPIFTHVNFDEAGLQLEALAQSGLLGPDCTYVHVTLLRDSTWKTIADTGGKVSLSTIAEQTVGVGTPAIQEAIDHGIQGRTSFGTDAELFMTCDFFSQIRAAFTVQRLLALRASNNGQVATPRPISCREILEMATIGGARGANLDHKVGTLTPGKQADIITLRTDRINVSPVSNVAGAVVTLMDTSNVDTVFIGGRVMKWRGQLVGVNVPKMLKQITASRDQLLKRAGWPLEPFGTCCSHQGQLGALP